MFLLLFIFALNIVAVQMLIPSKQLEGQGAGSAIQETRLDVVAAGLREGLGPPTVVRSPARASAPAMQQWSARLGEDEARIDSPCTHAPTRLSVPTADRAPRLPHART